MESDKSGDGKRGFTVNDRRWWLQEDAKIDELAQQAEQRRPSFVEDLEARLAEKDRTLRDYIQAHKTSVADLDEVRKRLERDLDQRVAIERARLVEPFLEVQDNLLRLATAARAGGASGDLLQGLQLILGQLADLLARLGLKPIATQGQRFDPKIMEALLTAEVDPAQDGMVQDEVRPGFMLGDKVVRPAGVRVGVARRS